MSDHPLNLGLRFALELIGLYALWYWGWHTHAGLARWAWAFGLPIIAAILWSTFRVSNDPGRAPVRVPGPVRLLLEVVYFGGAALAFYTAGRENWGLLLGVVVLAHYLLSYERVVKLIRDRQF